MKVKGLQSRTSQTDELVLLNLQMVTGSGHQDWSQSGIAAVHPGKTRVLATRNSDGKLPELSLVHKVLPESHQGLPNKLASLEATLVLNSAHRQGE